MDVASEPAAAAHGAPAGASWSVVREIGIEYAAPVQERAALRFACPIFSEPAGTGRQLVVDEIGLEKNRTVRIECRTVVLDDRGELLFDTHAMGVEDGFGCSLGDGRIALLRRSTWEVWILSPDFEVTGRFDFCAVSQRMPRVVRRTPRGTLLAAFVDKVKEVDVVEVDLDGSLLWSLPRDAAVIGCPSNVSGTDDGHVLVADDFLHRVVELDRDGRVRWQYGEAKHPASDERHLSAPKSVEALSGGRRLIADSGNHRVLLVEGDRCVARIDPSDADLRGPSFAAGAPEGGFLVCDSSNERVVRLAADGSLQRQWGSTLALRRSFSFPRSIEVRGDRLLVADTARDRLVEIADGRVEAWQAGPAEGLFWPRCARRTPWGSVVVADGRNSRIVEIASDGGILNELRSLDSTTCSRFSDPHDVTALPNGRLLVADSGSDVVAEVDWQGRVYRLLGPEAPAGLDDPHSVQALRGGELLVCDSGNSRIVWVDREGAIVRELTELTSGARRCLLNRPRYAELTEDGTLLIVDSGNNRVLGADRHGELQWELASIPGSPLPWLNQPRWAQLVAEDELVVSDHSNHRIVHLRQRPGAGG